MKVDLLSVMDRLIGNTRTMAGLLGDPRMREHLREGEQARAAVVELLEVANVVRQFLRSNKWGTIAYMEGSEVYNDLDDLAKVVDDAIAGAKP